jgi:hypothetical protein
MLRRRFAGSSWQGQMDEHVVPMEVGGGPAAVTELLEHGHQRIGVVAEHGDIPAVEGGWAVDMLLGFGQDVTATTGQLLGKLMSCPLVRRDSVGPPPR